MNDGRFHYIMSNKKRAMIYTKQYLSPLGVITLACDDSAIIGLWFNGQKYFGSVLPDIALATQTSAHTLLEDATRWLDIYFSGHNPNFLPPLKYDSTLFRTRVCQIMLTIPYGKTMTYGEIARIIAKERGVEKISGQAVGEAVGHNPIALMIPCHRVVGVNGCLTGYAGGLERKEKLLALEQFTGILLANIAKDNKIELCKT